MSETVCGHPVNGSALPGTATYGSSATRLTYTIWVDPAVAVDPVAVDGTLLGVWLVDGGLFEAGGADGDAPVGGGGAVVVNAGTPVGGGLVDPAPGVVAALDAATAVVADVEAKVAAVVVVVGTFDVARSPKSEV